MFTLYGAIRSSATWRVRIALEFKGVAYREIFHDLNKGEQNSAAYRKVNPQQLVPSLGCPNGAVQRQSVAIIEFLEEVQPLPALLPADPDGRARVRAIAQIIACDIHPINNLRVRNHVRDLFPEDAQAMSRWMDKWSKAGFDAIEALLADDSRTGLFCHGDQPTMADCFLVPQVGNARSMGQDISAYPVLTRIAGACDEVPAFHRAHSGRLRPP